MADFQYNYPRNFPDPKTFLEYIYEYIHIH